MVFHHSTLSKKAWVTSLSEATQEVDEEVGEEVTSYLNALL